MRQIPSILEDADNLLSSRMRALLVELRDEWEKLGTQIEEIDREFIQAAKKEENCRDQDFQYSGLKRGLQR